MNETRMRTSVYELFLNHFLMFEHERAETQASTF